MNEERPVYSWLVHFRNADDSGTGEIWIRCRDADEAFDGLEAARPGARWIKVLDKFKIQE